MDHRGGDHYRTDYRLRMAVLLQKKVRECGLGCGLGCTLALFVAQSITEAAVAAFGTV